MRFGLSISTLEKLVEVMKRSKTVKKAVIFGSRARGDYKYNSDIDIAIYTDGETYSGFLSDIDEAAGIYKIDVIDMDKLTNKKLRSNIERDGVEIFRR
jgi:predicted nucleotidyltransferase